MKISRFSGIIASVFVLIFAAGCGDTPTSAMENWRDALCSGDLEEANEYSTERTHPLNEIFILALKNDSKQREKFDALTPISEEISGDVAVVTYKTQNGGVKTINLVNEFDNWKVDYCK